MSDPERAARSPFWALASVLAEAPLRARRVEREDDGARIELIGGGASLTVHLRRGEAQRGEMALGPLALRYTLSGPVDREALASWVRQLVASFSAWEPLLAQAGRAHFSGIADAGPLAGWRLAALADERTLDFGDPESEQRVILAQREGGLHARHRTPAPPAIQDAIRAAAALALGVRTDGGGDDRKTSRVLEVVTDVAHPQGHEVRLLLNGPCEQRCAFCSIPDTFVPDAGDADALAGHRALLERRFAGGARVLRLTGVDPLASSFVVELLQHATSLGYEEITINSPCTRLGDRAFAEAVARAMPARRSVMIPVYGASAAAHDAIVGRVGAFDRVMAAIDNAVALLGAENVQLSTVLVPDVLDGFAGIASLAAARGLTLNVYLPFPDADSPFDRFERVTLPMSEVATSLIRNGASARQVLSVVGMKPCVGLSALEAVGLGEAARQWLSDQRGVLHDGSRTAHQPCPHREQCTLAPPCSGTLLSAYVRRHGAQELMPR